MDNAFTVSHAIELTMASRGDAVVLPSGQVVFLWRAAAVIGGRALALRPRLALTLRRHRPGSREASRIRRKAALTNLSASGKSAMQRDSALAALVAKRELQAVAAKQLVELLLAGKVKSEGSRFSGDWRESVPCSEYHGLVIENENAVDSVSGKPKIFDILIDAAALLRELKLLGVNYAVEAIAGPIEPTLRPPVSAIAPLAESRAGDPGVNVRVVEAATKQTAGYADYREVKDVVAEHGRDTELKLLTAVRQQLSDRKVSRKLVRDAIDELFGRPGRNGRSPKKVAVEKIAAEF